MEIAFYLKRPKAEETSLWVRISYDGYQLKYYISEKINPQFWNKNTHRAKETQKFKEYPEFNARLDSITSTIKNIYRKYKTDHDDTPPSAITLKDLLDKRLKNSGAPKDTIASFIPFFEDFIKRSLEGGRIDVKSKKGTVYNTNKGYISTLNHIKNFQTKCKRKIDFETIDLEFYKDYTSYLTRTIKLSNNTIGDHIKRVKTVLNEATELGINKNFAYRSKYFTKLSEEADSIYLTTEEIEDLEALDLSKNTRLDTVRDLFLIGCYTGLRYSDYSFLKPDNIREGFIEVTQQKTGAPVVIPIHTVVKKILTKYEGRLPKPISNQKTNDYLKEIGKLAPSLAGKVSRTRTTGGEKVTETFEKWELLTTHTARRSFATNEYKAGIPSITIMAITGHKTEKAFLKYIKLTPNEHAKILKLHWEKRNSLKAV